MRYSLPSTRYTRRFASAVIYISHVHGRKNGLKVLVVPTGRVDGFDSVQFLSALLFFYYCIFNWHGTLTAILFLTCFPIADSSSNAFLRVGSTCRALRTAGLVCKSVSLCRLPVCQHDIYAVGGHTTSDRYRVQGGTCSRVRPTYARRAKVQRRS